MLLERPPSSSHRGATSGPLGVSLDYPKIFSLLDRVRLATVETIEAMQTWHASEGGNESGSFIWHTKNYMLELLTDLDRTVSFFFFSFFLLDVFLNWIFLLCYLSSVFFFLSFISSSGAAVSRLFFSSVLPPPILSGCVCSVLTSLHFSLHFPLNFFLLFFLYLFHNTGTFFIDQRRNIISATCCSSTWL